MCERGECNDDHHPLLWPASQGLLAGQLLPVLRQDHPLRWLIPVPIAGRRFVARIRTTVAVVGRFVGTAKSVANHVKTAPVRNMA